MIMRRLDDNGMLMLELLLVLMISASLLLLPSLYSKKAMERLEVSLFKEQLESSITAIQTYSILAGIPTTMTVSAEYKRIDFKVFWEEDHYLNQRLLLPGNMTTPVQKRYQFLGNSGNLSRFDALNFDINGERHSLIFQLGSGRYRWN